MSNRSYHKMVYHDTPVLEFHEVFGHRYTVDPRTVPDIDQRVLRIQMIASELVELAHAFGVDLIINSTASKNEDECVTARGRTAAPHYDPVEAADALADIRYLVDGGNLICGFPGEAVLAEVHRSNMSKLGADGKPLRRADGKTLKGPNYTPPDIKGVLERESGVQL